MNLLHLTQNTTFGMRFIKTLPAFLLFIMADSWAQIGLPNATPVTENFNSMGSSSTASLPANWKISVAGAAAPTYAAGGNFTAVNNQASSGLPNAGGRWNWGTTAATDRALGTMTSGSYANPNSIMAQYRNTNGTFLTDLAISYSAERYRINTSGVNISFYYSLDGTNWTAVPAGDVAAASFPPAANSYTFGTPLTIPVSFNITGLSVANAGDIYLRWEIFGSPATNSQGVAIDDVSVTATFATGCSTPTTQASTIGVNTITNTGASFSWANGGATSGTMVVINPTSSASVAPTSGTSYTANTAWASAGLINTNNRVIYRGNATTASVTGLTPATQYTATIYAFNDPGSCYNTATPETINFYTLANEPTAHPAAGAFTCSTFSVSQINLSFPAANTVGSNANGYIILYRIGAAPTGVPTDGAYHAPGTVFGDATVLGYTSVAGTDTSFSATGLNAGTTYYFSLIPFGSFLSTAETLNYRTATTIRTTNCTTVTAPEINITGNAQTINPGNTPIFLDNTLYAAQTVSTTSAPKSFVIQNLGNANLVLTGPPYVTLGGANPGDFAISTAATSPIAASSSSTFAITFTPTATGIRTATVTVTSNDSTEPTYTFNIQGSGDDREIEVYGKGVSIPSGSATASAVNDTHFGNVNITAGTSQKNFAVFNTGGLILTISGVTITGPDAADFSITASPASSLNQNVSTILSITFDPATIGVKNATVTINNDDTNESAYTFAIQGNGIDYTDCGLGTYEVIGQQDFEASPAAPVMTYSYTQESGAGIVTVGGGTGRGSSRTVASNMFAGARSFQIAGHLANSGVEKLTTVDFASVNASAFTDVNMSFKLGGYSSNNTQGMDTTPEKVTVYLSTDNGATWSQEVDIYGSNNAIWDINTSSGSAAANFDGNNITTIFQAGNNSVNTGPRTITLSNLPSSAQLKVRITLSLDRTDEIWVIDDVKFQGRKTAETIWNGTSWSNGVPNTTVKAIINGAYNTAVNGNIRTCRCEVNAGFTLTVGANTFLEIQDNLLNNGTVNVANSGSLVQVNNYAANTGNISVGRDVNMRKYDYVYWSAPVANFAVTAVSPGTASNYIYKWQPTQAGSYGIWVGTGENMVTGKGYIVRGPSAWTTTFSVYSASFAGAPNNGIITPSIERGSYTGANYANPNGVIVTNQDDNWNLVGNPYPSSIRALDFLNANTNIEGAVRLWTHGSLPSAVVTDPFYGNFLYNYNSNDYIVYNGTGTVSGPAGFNGYIASGQGFFVQMNDGPAATQTLTFNNSMRNRTYGNAQFYRPAAAVSNRTDETMGEPSRIWLDLIGSDQMVSRTLVGYVDGATLEKDRLYDAYGKRDNSLNFYSLIGEDAIAIQGRPLPFDENDVVPLGLHLATGGSYKIGIAAVDGLFGSNDAAVFLEDKTLGLVHDLRQSPYDFTAAAGILDDRFLLRYQAQSLGTDDFVGTQNQVAIAVSDRQINIRSFSEPIQKAEVYDLLGRSVFNQDNVNSKELSIFETGARQQVVLVKLTLKNGRQISRKILL